MAYITNVRIKNVKEKLKDKSSKESIKAVYDYYYGKYHDFVSLYSGIEGIEEIYSEVIANCIDEYADLESTEFIGEIIKRRFMNQVRLYNNDRFKYGKRNIMEELTKAAIDNKEARETLIERYMYLIDRYLKNIKFNSIFTEEDAKQIGCLYLVDRVNKYFEKERNYPLSLYLNDFFKKDYIPKIVEACQFQNEEIPSGLLKLQEDLTDEFFEFEWNDFVDSDKYLLPDTKERLKYLPENNKCKIAEYFDVSRQAIDQACEKARVKAKRFKI